ncbi:HAD family hydrolase [Vogesella sp. AC12]|uniref:HAD family hydrolase n=1 Tax=Vogesella sp. AC12 TaxID=2950550 RepID=UPI00210CBF63|nr:HAD family hydrolase [Vogesella sp. AC12]MCQ4144793.1 HAD family hydrolase [Vogesella sp. AC12]
MKKVLITDLDNTLFDWFSFWHSAFGAMVKKVSEISGVSLDELIPEIRLIHQEHGTSEYAFLLEEMPSLQRIFLSSSRVREQMIPAIEAYRAGRSESLRLYPKVKETLQELKRRKIILIGYTESRYYYSAYRIKALGLDGLLDSIYLPEDHHIPNERVDDLKPIPLASRVHFTPEGEVKPNPKILLGILKDVKIDPWEAVYIGDSEMKDIAMAQDAGIFDVHAKYGATHFIDRADDYKLLQKVSHWTSQDVQREVEVKRRGKIVPSCSVDSFDKILDFFKAEEN